MSTPSALDYADFRDRVGADFALHLPDGHQAPLVLTECTSHALGSFSLIFKAGPAAPAEQATYQVSTDDFGPEPIFLVPMAYQPDDLAFPLIYQAIFNSARAPVRPSDPTASVHRLEEEAR
jgi:hypothetical protein